jgi:carnosine N-methyltransferase
MSAKADDHSSSSSDEKEEGSGGTGEDCHSLGIAYQTYMQKDEKEQNHWHDVVLSYRQYASFAMSQWANTMYRIHSLPEEYRSVLPGALRRDTPEFHARATLFKEAAIRNQFCLDCILRHAGQPHSQQEFVAASKRYVSDAQISKTASVLKSLMRDWSTEGKPERDMSYKPIIEALKRVLPVTSAGPPRVCVPGAGVGRLALEICREGYSVQGNEFSLYMLLASDFILNGGIATPDTPLIISPWLLETRNVHETTDPVRTISVPDVDPHTYLSLADDVTKDVDETPPSVDDVDNVAQNKHEASRSCEFSMAAGEFASVYNIPGEHERWNAVVACFFLDASPCIVEYLITIHRMLKPGGILINFGPLLWHWSGPAMRPDDRDVDSYHKRCSYLDTKYLTSIDVCWDDVREIMLNIGFEFLEVSTGNRSLYTADRRSMMNMDYRCLSFVARKSLPPVDVKATASTAVLIPS